MAKLATFYDHILEMAKQRDMSEQEAMQEAKKLGVQQLEVSVNNGKGHEKELGRLLAAVGLGISSIPSFFDFGRDPDVECQAEPALALAKELGASRLLVIPGFTQGSPEEVEVQTETMVAGTVRLGELAAKADISLTMEDFDNAAAPFSTSHGMLRFINACPGLTACFDTGNFRFMAEDELEAYERLWGHIGHVHLKDRAFAPAYGKTGPVSVDGKTLYPCATGYGEIKIDEVIARLKADGYDGTYTIEHYDAGDMLDCLKKSAEWVLARI